MRIAIDTTARTLTADGGTGTRTHSLDSPEAFSILSRVWITTGWSQKYSYGFQWMGRPVIQLPEDLVTVQEVIHRVRPDVIVETGVAHGGSLVFYASLCAALGSGRVVGVDVDIRPPAREALEAHPLGRLITLVSGDSVDPGVVRRVADPIRPGERVLVILDSNHSFAHVSAELEAYAPLVTPGSYLVAADGVMEWLTDVPGVPASWADDNPMKAVERFLPRHPEFSLEDPPRIGFNEGSIAERVTYWPKAYLRRLDR